jgi:hypothetical protein
MGGGSSFLFLFGLSVFRSNPIVEIKDFGLACLAIFNQS